MISLFLAIGWIDEGMRIDMKMERMEARQEAQAGADFIVGRKVRGDFSDPSRLRRSRA